MSNDSPTNLNGLRVAIFESRMAGSLADLVTRHGGVPLSAPTMREIPLQDDGEAQSFFDKLAGGAFDLTIFETGVGIRYLVSQLADRITPAQWAEALRRTTVVVRGPKPAVALRELGVTIDLSVPSPNTWRETLALLDEKHPPAGLSVAVQEYGQSPTELIEGLKLRGAVVTSVPVYRWELPEDLGPLREVLVAIVAGEVDAALFTSAQQIEHVLKVAAGSGLEADLRDELQRRVIVGSVGPTTSEALRARGLPVDVEPRHPKSGHLVAALAAGWRHVHKASRPE